MATITKGVTFADGDTVTHTKLNNLIDDATLGSISQTDLATSSGLVITAGTAPSDTDALWRDSASSNVLKYYNGSAWVSVELDKSVVLELTDDLAVSGAVSIGGVLTLDADDMAIYDADPTLTDDKHLATKKYVDDNTPTDGVVKAWVNFNGSGTVTINDHFNVSSITDNGVGDYTINWDTNFANAYYAVVGNARDSVVRLEQATTSKVEARVKNSSGAPYDSPEISIIAIGNQ